ncbi:MAG: hypothetical protein AAGB33_00210, partial [Cellulomonas sp.]|nr:hypothetical protein [Rickettsiella sp.]
RIYKIILSLRAMKKKLLSIEIILGNLSREAIDIVNLTHFVDTKLLIDDLEEISDLYITLGPTFDFLSEIIEIDSAELESVKRIQYDNLLIMLQDRISEYQTQYSLADDSVSENSSQISCWKKIWQLLNVCLQNFRNWIFLSCAKNSNLSTNRYNYFQEPTVLINDQIENLIHLFEKN